MTISDIPVMPKFFDRYINLAGNDWLLLDALTQGVSFENLIPAETLEKLGDLRYEPGKWTVKDILQHIIDTERIMSYRAMRIARNDKTPLPGFDEVMFGEFANGIHRTIPDLYEEYTLVRQSNIALFKSFTDEMLLRTGTCSDQPISVIALGFVLVGHATHHVNVINERYLPLL
ncbi:DinB family protein [Spirosoma aerophilum]